MEVRLSLGHFSPTSRRSAEGRAAVAVAALGIVFFRWFSGRESRQIDTKLLTYSAVITYFVENRPDDEQIRCGALLRERRPRFWVVSFVFLNAGGTICTRADGTRYGRTLRVRQFDEEMLELFSDKDLVIFE
jgi:hypothetical protein